MKSVNPYLNFPGNTEEAFNFYKSVFGGEFSMLMRMKDAPLQNIPAGFENKIMHVALPLPTGQVLMGTDACEEAGHELSAGNNFYISIAADSEAEGKELFDKLAAGGKAEVPYSKQFWGDLFGQLVDQFGGRWMVGYHEEK